jgi:hypothetical protein
VKRVTVEIKETHPVGLIVLGYYDHHHVMTDAVWSTFKSGIFGGIV